MPPSLTGPRLSPRSGTASQLVVFLHGYGADGNDLIEIGREWQRWLPDAAFVAPNAPELIPGQPMGRQWFALTFRDPHERWRGVNQAGPGLDAFLDAELERHKLLPSKLALVGFSQGTMLALHLALRRTQAVAAVVGYSGMLVLEEGKGAESLKGAIRSKPPILLIHGDQDDLIPLEPSSSQPKRSPPPRRRSSGISRPEWRMASTPRAAPRRPLSRPRLRAALPETSALTARPP